MRLAVNVHSSCGCGPRGERAARKWRAGQYGAGVHGARAVCLRRTEPGNVGGAAGGTARAGVRDNGGHALDTHRARRTGQSHPLTGR